MARTLLVTPVEMAAGWIVRPGMPCPSPHSCPPLTRQMCRYGGVHPPADLVAAAMPCETCGGRRKVTVSETYHGDGWIDRPCYDCRITLLGECPECRGRGGWRQVWDDERGIRHEEWWNCRACGGVSNKDDWRRGSGTVTLGYAYPVGDPAALVGQFALWIAVTT